MNQELLKEHADSGKSINDIAKIYGKSATSIRHWLKKFNLKTSGKVGNSNPEIRHDGRTCNVCKIFKPFDAYTMRKDRPGTVVPTCKVCNSIRTKAKQKDIKCLCINYLGNKCKLCDGVFDSEQYDFHHTEPEHKDFEIRDRRGLTFESLVKELNKCILVCANCHQYIHHKMKINSGYVNKIPGNTELWSDNKRKKLDFIGKTCCDKCGYNEYLGAIGLVFKEHYKHFRKYNKTHWADDFKDALKQSSVLCLNCIRMS